MNNSYSFPSSAPSLAACAAQRCSRKNCLAARFTRKSEPLRTALSARLRIARPVACMQ